MITSKDVRATVDEIQKLKPEERSPVDGAVIQFGNTFASALQDREERLAKPKADAPAEKPAKK